MILTEKGVAEIGIGTVIDMIADAVAQGAGLVIEEVVAEDIDRDHEIVIDTLNPTGDQDPEIEKEEDALGHIREKEGNMHISKNMVDRYNCDCKNCYKLLRQFSKRIYRHRSRSRESKEREAKTDYASNGSSRTKQEREVSPT